MQAHLLQGTHKVASHQVGKEHRTSLQEIGCFDDWIGTRNLEDGTRLQLTMPNQMLMYDPLR